MEKLSFSTNGQWTLSKARPTLFETGRKKLSHLTPAEQRNIPATPEQLGSARAKLKRTNAKNPDAYASSRYSSKIATSTLPESPSESTQQPTPSNKIA